MFKIKFLVSLGMLVLLPGLLMAKFNGRVVGVQGLDEIVVTTQNGKKKLKLAGIVWKKFTDKAPVKDFEKKAKRYLRDILLGRDVTVFTDAKTSDTHYLFFTAVVEKQGDPTSNSHKRIFLNQHLLQTGLVTIKKNDFTMKKRFQETVAQNPYSAGVVKKLLNRYAPVKKSTVKKKKSDVFAHDQVEKILAAERVRRASLPNRAYFGATPYYGPGYPATSYIAPGVTVHRSYSPYPGVRMVPTIQTINGKSVIVRVPVYSTYAPYGGNYPLYGGGGYGYGNGYSFFGQTGYSVGSYTHSHGNYSNPFLQKGTSHGTLSFSKKFGGKLFKYSTSDGLSYSKTGGKFRFNLTIK